MKTFTERFAWIFEHRGTNPSALAESAGLSRSHIRGLLESEAEGRRVRPGPDTVHAIARAANVSARWLSSGRGPVEPYEGEAQSPTPPPVSDTVTSTLAIDELIDSAYDPARHLPSDTVPVREALRLGAPLLRAAVDPTTYVRNLLDAAARSRVKGQRVKADELPSATVSMLSEELAHERERAVRLEELLAGANEWMIANGIEPPKPGEAPPAITLAAQKAMLAKAAPAAAPARAQKPRPTSQKNSK